MTYTSFLLPFQANCHFQGALHHARSWKISSDKNEKDMKREKSKRVKVEGRLKTKEEELANAHADLVKYKDKREKMINSYMTSPEFQALMTQHDEAIYPSHFAIGWDAALKAVN